jgi:parvulin-like peptidyl-prolyl isomerase
MFRKYAILTISIICLLGSVAGAKVIDKVVAFVDDEAITLSELEETYSAMQEISPDITKREALNTIINRQLLLREAHRLRLEAQSDDALLEDYIDMKVRAFIKVKESDIKAFYDNNTAEFGGKPFSEVRDEIEAYLQEKEVNYEIRRHLDALKEKAHIEILLDEP